MKNISLYQLRWPKFKLEAKGCLSLFNYSIDMSPTLMSPLCVEKKMFLKEKNMFFDNIGLMSMK